MSTRPRTVTGARRSPAEVQKLIRARIDSLSYLPTTAAVAMKFIELGKRLSVEPADYAKVVSADSSLSSKLLALANSSWAGVRNRVTNIKMAVNLLGLGTVRTLAISYCMTGLHNELHLPMAQAELLWEASLTKALAARRLASAFDVRLADEAYVAGLFQDFALAVLCAVARESYLDLLRDPATTVEAQLQQERAMFGTDHTEIGCALALKLELPEPFTDTVAFHHDYAKLAEGVQDGALRDATYAAGLLPHLPNVSHAEDAENLTAFLRQKVGITDVMSYLAGVQAEFVELYTFFHQGHVPQAQLTDLLERTAREAAENTTGLVRTVNELLREAATSGLEMDRRVRELEGEANHDQLTGVLNRNGFMLVAEDTLLAAACHQSGVAVFYLDVDQFKHLNDTHGHAFGDYVLKAVVSATIRVLPPGAVFGRIGGDEFCILLAATREQAEDVLRRTVAGVAECPVSDGELSAPITVSAGMVYLESFEQRQSLESLVKAADQLMYAAKRAGRNRVVTEKG